MQRPCRIRSVSEPVSVSQASGAALGRLVPRGAPPANFSSVSSPSPYPPPFAIRCPLSHCVCCRCRSSLMIDDPFLSFSASRQRLYRAPPPPPPRDEIERSSLYSNRHYHSDAISRRTSSSTFATARSDRVGSRLRP